TPHEYLFDFKISESKKKLLRSENIADIVIQLGFSDQSHFSKIFRKTVGVPPGKYCKTNKNCYRDREPHH
ncbi:MAG: helix-turn-helix domain-containing protein, partial [Deltaproteobacteria bacterium]|nr:helix-turn-helix domain-containing protein [Deltaproteobacteria bacterium]